MDDTDDQANTDDKATRFEEQRPHLRAVAYRMLGSFAEADDAVQEAWVRYGRTDTSDVENLRAWLTTVVSRVSLNILRSRRTRQRGAGGAAHAGPHPGPPRRDRSRARGAPGRLRRRRPARRARHPGAGRAAGVRPARHLRRPLRRDRADRRALARGGTPAGQPRPPAHPGRADRPRHRRPAPAGGGRRLPRRLARTATSTRCSPSSIPMSSSAPTRAPWPGGAAAGPSRPHPCAAPRRWPAGPWSSPRSAC